ncbi:response regulator [Clostridium estertheticum]|uniref:response regulator transcription factor n=1 Tax=Clostridium estertheticum TaxID=238834 RepID=UPI001C0CDD31|nr:response regulator [Clostridium estertheticum]MBU3199937.1 response regulator [Clostridium estertheticum]WAG66965.1 response regulator [Clostridium estertheticum]
MKDMYTLIIADDEFIIRQGLMSFKWEIFGFKVIGSASDGEEVLNIMKNKPTDLLVTDIQMPIIDGLKLSEIIRNLYPSTKVIILTGYKNFEYAQKAINSGVSDYLLKPVDLTEMGNLILKVKEELDAEASTKELIYNYERQLKEISIKSSEQITMNGYAKSSSHNAVQQVVNHIKEHYNMKITLNDMAEKVYLNSSYLSVQFKKEMGINFIDYIKKVRIEKAKELLKRIDLKSYEVCEAVGYKDYKYFTELFKELTGLTPLEFRQKLNTK